MLIWLFMGGDGTFNEVMDGRQETKQIDTITYSSRTTNDVGVMLVMVRI